ncbi:MULTISPECIES: DNA mismatch repair endonuclease MutH [Shewanella]|uniref:DNA mismatch repair endonuclease MutH n=1 Tax=Shewanella TaxID=22 RepID=UPI0006E4CFF1|nr:MULTISPECIES: DNA mismatch repair endonuclease MutH [Shewanella]KPZ68960.1 DNA mismatch repair protein MutH [Shewanella sp. P1-14-1]MBQ4888658.1 DNA mismatch repair endonuclease MutH [Shewanella sp. MMG014]
MMNSQPNSIAELMQRANDMAGVSLGDIANEHQLNVPDNLKRDKGWIGQLIEMELGATAGSKPQQDFLHLGVELKTIPIDQSGRPIETTYVTVAPLTNIQGLTWENSVVFHKLQQVLWIPVQGDRSIPVANRKIGTPVLWSPNPEQLTALQQDWEEIMEMIALGQVEKVTARHGEVLQLRPKAANSHSLTESIAENGLIKLSNPRGFYLKINFTHQILTNAFG